MDSFISWVGGKRALRQIILPLFPACYERYIEVFGGAGWMMFYKPPDKFEVFNDYNGNLTNMYRVVKEQTLAFIKELGFLPINSRDDFVLLKKFMKQEVFADEAVAAELQLAKVYFNGEDLHEIKEILNKREPEYCNVRAASFYKIIHYSYGSGCKSVGCQPCDIRKLFGTIWGASHRLANVFIENKDFEAVIRHYDRVNSFFYCDPPYFETEDCYEADFTKDDHARLHDTLASASGKWLLSYNDCEYIRDLYKDYNIMAISRISNLAQRYAGGAEYAELLIANYDFDDQPRQLSFFEGGAS